VTEVVSGVRGRMIEARQAMLGVEEMTPEAREMRVEVEVMRGMGEMMTKVKEMM
jgi:hypothetical protein